MIILKEKRQAICIPKQRPFHRDFLDFRSLGYVKGLGGRGVGCGGEVEIVLVEIDFQSARGAGGGGCADED